MKAKKIPQVGLFSRISIETKEKFEDIVYALDVKNHEAMETVIRYYYESRKIGPRPSRKRTGWRYPNRSTVIPITATPKLKGKNAFSKPKKVKDPR